MRRFLITSTKFSGTAELDYNAEGWLAVINMTDTNMQPEIRLAFIRNVPLTITHLECGGHGLKSCTIVEKDITVTLEDFIQEYPYKRNMHLLPDRWKKLTKSEQVIAVSAASDYRKYLQRNTWCSPRIADAWLKNKEFLNDWKKL